MAKSQLWSKISLWLMLWMFSAALLMVASWDSYLHDIYLHYDTPWFFMCGKAWMNGLKPYVDFADSKGPLLWLIYGLGYLISPRDYTGIYWISTLFFTIAFYYAYKSALLITGNRATAALATAIMAFLMLVKWIHDETRCEDFCCAAIMPVVYFFIKCNKTTSSNGSLVKKSAFTLGISLGVTLMIKYNFTAMVAVSIPYFAWIMPRRLNCSPWRALKWIAIGSAAVMAPIICVLAAQGCFLDFLREYFLVTAKTINNLQTEGTVGQRISFVLGSHLVQIYLLLINVLVIVAVWKVRSWRWPLVVAFVWCVIIIALNLKNPFYLQPLSLFAMPGVALTVKPLNRILSRWQWKITAVAAVMALLMWGSNKGTFFNLPETAKQRVFYYFAALQAQYDKPKIIYLNCFDLGSSVPVDALPGCKYWARQAGATSEMIEQNRQAVLHGNADVVIVETNDRSGRNLLDSIGYHCYSSRGAGVEHFDHTLYSRQPLDTIKAAAFHITPRDIVCKRRLFP